MVGIERGLDVCSAWKGARRSPPAPAVQHLLSFVLGKHCHARQCEASFGRGHRSRHGGRHGDRLTDLALLDPDAKGAKFAIRPLLSWRSPPLSQRLDELGTAGSLDSRLRAEGAFGCQLVSA